MKSVYSKQNIIAICVFFATCYSINAQISTGLPSYGSQSPSVSSLLRFEEVPVSHYTGVPNISIPLFSLQSHSKDIGLDLTLGYHPSGAGADERAGALGLGWSIFSDAVISRDLDHLNLPDEYQFINAGWPPPVTYPITSSYKGNDLYQYSFMGYSGRFIINRVSETGLVLEVVENNPSVNIKFDYNPSTLVVNSFTIRDPKGYTFVFDIYDEVTTPFLAFFGNPWNPNPSDGYIRHRPSYYLSTIKDKNNQVLMQYAYDTYSVPIPTLWMGAGEPDDVFKKLNMIDVIGKGKAVFNYSFGTDPDPESPNDRSVLMDVVIKDYNDNPVKKFTFARSADFKGSSILRKIEESNFQNDEKRTYRFYYKRNQDITSSNYHNKLMKDRYGYYKRKDLCKPGIPNFSDTDTEYCNLGVLEKITYPAGGFTTYEYESNSYSPYEDESEYHNELHNNYSELYATLSKGPGGPYSFTGNFGTGKTLYFKLTNPSIPTDQSPDGDYYFGDEEGNPVGNVYSQIGLTRNGDPYPVTGNILSPVHNNENECYGHDLFIGGSVDDVFGISSSLFNPNVRLDVYEKKHNPVIKKWINGGGIRIKKIAFYEGTVNEEDPSIAAPPVKEVNYKYTTFADALKSSGAIAEVLHDPINGMYVPKKELVGYANVTEFETGKGRTEYSFINSDSLQPGDTIFKFQRYYDYRKGLIKKKEIFDEAGKSLAESYYDYEFDGDTIQGGNFEGDLPVLGIILYERNGWVKKQTAYNKSRFYTGSTQTTVETKDITAYNDVRLLDYTISNAASTTEALETRYFYVPLPTSVEIEKIENRRGSVLMSTQKIIYSGSLGSACYLPATIQSAKGDRSLESRVQFVKYDQYSNPLEVKLENGTPVSYIWGHNKTQPVAMVENATYEQLATALGTSVTTLRDTYSEANMVAIDNLRTTLPAAMVTTYTYTPLVGVASITDPKGYIATYHYDAMGRLQYVKDQDGNLLSENEYHYRP